MLKFILVMLNWVRTTHSILYHIIRLLCIGVLCYFFGCGNKGQNNSSPNNIEAYSSLSSHKSISEPDQALYQHVKFVSWPEMAALALTITSIPPLVRRGEENAQCTVLQARPRSSSFLPMGYGLNFNQMATPSFKGGWEMKSLCWASMCSVKIPGFFY